MDNFNPFCCENALQYANYHPLYTTKNPAPSGISPQVSAVAQKLNSFIVEKKHPCLGAHSAVRGKAVRFGYYPPLGSKEAAAGLCHDLVEYIQDRETINKPLASFMAVFDGPDELSEMEFESLLWQQLGMIKEASDQHYCPDSRVSDDPEHGNFSFSFGGKAFYIVGMHPNSSRKARQFSQPMLVFNLHEQFEWLRERDSYEKLRSSIQARDMALQGSINPMMEDFGNTSEARQYSGRKVGSAWKCPLGY
jgi:FPC/CPF motif-containing protein YcgG